MRSLAVVAVFLVVHGSIVAMLTGDMAPVAAIAQWIAGATLLALLVGIPGYVLEVTIASGSARPPLHRALLILCLGVAVVITAGLVLDLAGVGLDWRGWWALVLASGLAAALPAIRRQVRVDRLVHRWPRIGTRQMGGAALAAAFVALAVGVSVISAVAAASAERFTVLAAALDASGLDVRVENREGRRVTYELIGVAGDTHVLQRRFAVDDGTTAEFRIPMPSSGLTVSLYAGDDPEPYRWLRVTPPEDG